MKLTSSRLKHCRGVAEKMRKMVLSNPDKYHLVPGEMYILDMLHDIGYAFVRNHRDHAIAGAEILRDSEYKYWKEVLYHSSDQNEYDSVALQLLNYADLTVGPNGEDMTIPERIGDISARYGQGSIQVQNALAVMEKLKQLGYKTF